MTIPQNEHHSDKLNAQEEVDTPVAPSALMEGEANARSVVQIREVECLNDFVAILVFEHDSGSIVVPDSESKYKNEGIVVGVGCGLPDNAGGRTKSQLEIGDVVMFGKNVIMEIASDSPPYAGHRVVLMSEKNTLCKLHRKIEWESYKG